MLYKYTGDGASPKFTVVWRIVQVNASQFLWVNELMEIAFLWQSSTGSSLPSVCCPHVMHCSVSACVLEKMGLEAVAVWRNHHLSQWGSKPRLSPDFSNASFGIGKNPVSLYFLGTGLQKQQDWW